MHVDETQTRAKSQLIDDLYVEHGSVLRGYVTRLLGGDYKKAEDIVQETLLRAWRHADRLYDVDGSIRGWLIRVAHNLVIDAQRTAMARPAEVCFDRAMHVVGADPTDKSLTAIVIRSALQELNPEHRSVLTRLYLDGLSGAETALDLGIPVGTVKSRAFYGLGKLRRALDVAHSEGV